MKPCPRRVPPPPLPRPRLTYRLQAALVARVASIVAPAGYGKSTLVAQWRATPQERQPRVAMIMLQERDDDVLRFARHLIEAVELLGVDPEYIVDLKAFAHSQIRDPAREVPEGFRRRLREAFDEVPQRSVLVLEDVHHLHRANVLALLDFLGDELPPPVRLLLTSRTCTPLRRAAVMRVRGQLTELCANDLAFTRDEAHAYLSEQVGSLMARQAELLVERCEGWIAGLHLAGRALVMHHDPDAFLRAFTGRTRDVSEFLGQEVLDHRPPDVRDFLLDTAVLEVLSAEICQAVTGREDSGAILRELEEEAGFVFAIDEGENYRFHTLFAEFLRGELGRAEPERARRAHLRAAEWLASHDRVPEAFDHAIAADDFVFAATLLTQLVCAAGSPHPDAELEALFAKLPRHIIEEHSTLALWMGHSALWAGQPAEALLWCERLEKLPGHADIAAEASCLRTVAYWTLGDVAQTVAWGERARAVLDERDSTNRHHDAYPRLTMMEALAEAYACTDRFEAALEVLRDGLYRSRDGVHPPAFVTFPGKKAALLSHLGKLDHVREYAELSLAAAEQVGETDQPTTLEAHVALGELLCEGDDLAEAEQEFRIADRVEAGPDRVSIRARGMLGLARCLFHQGRVSEAFEELHAVMSIDGRGALPEFVRQRVIEHQIRLRLVNHDLIGAHGWLSELHRVVGDAPVYHGLRTWFDLEDGAQPELVYDAARALLNNGVARPAQVTVRLHMILARAARLRGDLEESKANVIAGFGIAAPQFMVRTLIEGAGADCRDFLKDAVNDGPPLPQRFVDALCRTLDRDAAPKTKPRAIRDEHGPSGPIESLTNTELELIPFLATELTYAEIGAQRFVSVNTVKSQLQAVYRKLGVSSRIAAIERSRALGLGRVAANPQAGEPFHPSEQ